MLFTFLNLVSQNAHKEEFNIFTFTSSFIFLKTAAIIFFHLLSKLEQNQVLKMLAALPGSLTSAVVVQGSLSIWYKPFLDNSAQLLPCHVLSRTEGKHQVFFRWHSVPVGYLHLFIFFNIPTLLIKTESTSNYISAQKCRNCSSGCNTLQLTPLELHF